MFFGNKDLQHKLDLTEKTCNDLVRHSIISKYGMVRKKRLAGPFNVYGERTINHLLFYLQKHEGETNEERARNLIASVANKEPLYLNQEELDMFLAQTDLLEMKKQLTSIASAVSALVSGVPHPAAVAPVAVKAPKKKKVSEIVEALRATPQTKASVTVAAEDIIAGICKGALPADAEFKKADCVALVDSPWLTNRMRKHKDLVWEHTRNVLFATGYLARGSRPETLKLGTHNA